MSMPDDDLSALIKQQATYHKAGQKLRADVSTRIALLSAASREMSTDDKAMPHVDKPVRKMAWPRYQSIAAFAMGVVMTVMLSPLMVQWTQAWRQPDDEALVAEHVRAIKTGPLIQVASSDRHTVKPWFQGKIDYAPAVLDLADAGFALTGGRIEHLGGEATAVLVYTHHQHIVNLFIWPADGAASPQEHQYRGFKLRYWQDGGLRYGLVTDMDAAEVGHFEQAWHEHRSRL